MTARRAGSTSYNAASDVVRTLAISDVPIPTATAATNVTATSATLNGTVNASNKTTTVYFCWYQKGFVASLVCTAATPATVSGTSATAVSLDISGLTEGATYIYDVKANNGNGGDQNSATQTVTKAKPQSITFSQPADMAVGDADQALTATSSSTLAVSLTATPSGVCAISGDALQAVGPGACTVTASQAGGTTGGITYTAATDVPYTVQISSAPVVTTGAATSITTTSATLNGTVNASNKATTVSVCSYPQGSPGSRVCSAATPATATGTGSTPVSLALSSLTPGTTYVYWVRATNGNGPDVDGSHAVVTTKQNQTITFNQPTLVLGSADVTPDATATSGLTVTVCRPQAASAPSCLAPSTRSRSARAA